MNPVKVKNQFWLYHEILGYTTRFVMSYSNPAYCIFEGKERQRSVVDLQTQIMSKLFISVHINVHHVPNFGFFSYISTSFVRTNSMLEGVSPDVRNVMQSCLVTEHFTSKQMSQGINFARGEQTLIVVNMCKKICLAQVEIFRDFPFDEFDIQAPHAMQHGSPDRRSGFPQPGRVSSSQRCQVINVEVWDPGSHHQET